MDRLGLEMVSALDKWMILTYLLSVLTLRLLFIWVCKWKAATKWAKAAKEILLQVRNKRHECLEGVNGVVKERKIEATAENVKEEVDDAKICMMTVKELQSSMGKGEFTCERCLMAFIRRTRRLGLNECNAVTEELYDSAVSKARDLDKSGILRKPPKADQPLLGVPVSIKDAFAQEDCLSTEGATCLALQHHRHIKDGFILSLLRSSGAIPFVRTNVPQMLFMCETENFLWGRTSNPWNTLRTPGGSSGGEAALVALRASPLGCGSDIGGSIRIPSHFSGVVGFKPTSARLTRMGMSGRARKKKPPGKKPIIPSSGPIANSVADCETFMRAIVGPKMFEGDPNVVPLPWNATLSQRGPGRPLRIGFFSSDGFFEPCSAVSRAVQEATAALKAAGHEVIPFTPPYTGWDIFRIYSRAINGENLMGTITDALEGEALLAQYKVFSALVKIPNWLRPILSFVLRQLGQHRSSHIVSSVRKNGRLSQEAFSSLLSDIRELQETLHNVMKESNMDALLFPTLPLPAFEFGKASHLHPILSYTFVGNVLDWPSGSVPVTVVAENEQEYIHSDDLPKNQRCSFAYLARCVMKGAAGLPCGVQIMAGAYKEELCLFAMAELERELCKKRSLHCMVPPLARDTNSK